MEHGPCDDSNNEAVIADRSHQLLTQGTQSAVIDDVIISYSTTIRQYRSPLTLIHIVAVVV